MSAPSSSMRELARRLLQATQSSASPAEPREPPLPQAAVETCERLRAALSRFAGPEGFASLLRRAMTLARAEVPALENVRLDATGRMEGMEEVVAGADGTEAAVALATHLLNLLVIFIGEPLTLHLVRDGWPELEAGPNTTPEG